MARTVRTRSVVASAVVALTLVAVVGLSVGRAEPRPDLPPVAPDRLIPSALSAIAERTPVSGTVNTHVDLGIPQLPAGLNDPAGPAGVLLSDQTFKEWFSSEGTRVAQILPFAERVLVVDRTDVWFWDSSRFTAWHHSIPASEVPPAAPPVGDLQDVVATVLRDVGPYAEVSLAVPTVVAGRHAYMLRLMPRSSDTLIGRIEVAIDAETRLPLRIAIFARGSSNPSVEAGFTSVDIGPVDPAMFTFTPPPGATVKEARPNQSSPEGAVQMPEVRVFGEGFGLIVAARVTEAPKELRSLLPYAGPLGSAILVDRGGHAWILAGAVAPDVLDAAASGLP